MQETLFLKEEMPSHLLDIRYVGDSFKGVMEISSLRTEIDGIENTLRILTQTLAKHKRIDFNIGDLEVFIEAFEKGSFKEKVLVKVKGLNDHQGALLLATALIMIFQTIPLYSTEEITEMSPELMVKIRDQVQLDLLKNPEFLKSVADIVAPLNQTGDQFHFSVPQKGETVITYEDKAKFLGLATSTKENLEDGDRREKLIGRINRVDLDATVRHLGFKAADGGKSIPATLDEELKKDLNMTSLLGEWVEVEGVSTYKNKTRDHIKITNIKNVNQTEFDFLEHAEQD